MHGNVKPLCMAINLGPSRYIIIIFTRIHIYRKCSKTILFPFFKHQKTIDGITDIYIRCNMIGFRMVKI